MDQIGRHCFISGVVQGVFYRQNTKEQAQRNNVTGWVKNLKDGRVEVLMYGTPSQIEAMKKWLAVGPERAIVTNLESFEVKYEPHSSFEIIRE